MKTLQFWMAYNQRLSQFTSTERVKSPPKHAKEAAPYLNNFLNKKFISN